MSKFSQFAPINGTGGMYGTKQKLLLCPGLKALSGAGFVGIGTYGTARSTRPRTYKPIDNLSTVSLAYILGVSRTYRMSLCLFFAGFSRDIRFLALSRMSLFTLNFKK
jgi:hypothetical protein